MTKTTEELFQRWLAEEHAEDVAAGGSLTLLREIFTQELEIKKLVELGERARIHEQPQKK